jgi:hypothetical protein
MISGICPVQGKFDGFCAGLDTVYFFLLLGFLFFPTYLPYCLPPSFPNCLPASLIDCRPAYLPIYLPSCLMADTFNERHTPPYSFPHPLLPHLTAYPSIPRNMVRNSICRMTMHGKWWINDPDCILLRKSTNYSDLEILGIATVKAMSGERMGQDVIDWDGMD